MAGWHHWLNGHEFESTLGVGDGQGGLACCSPWGCKELDMTERLNRTELIATCKKWKRARISVKKVYKKYLPYSRPIFHPCYEVMTYFSSWNFFTTIYPYTLHNCGNSFELWCGRRLLRVSWTARRSNLSILREISPEYSLEVYIGIPLYPSLYPPQLW